MATDPPPDPSPDDLLLRLSQHAPAASRYKLEGEVARGGMGSIIKVWDVDLRRHLAMKVVLGQGEGEHTGATPAVDSRQLARFLEEAQVTGQLDHPGIVPVHELGLDSDGRVYFTMKLVKGRDLKSIFELVFEGREDWNETRALGVILKACEAMAYAHSKGVIHRDLKPSNVMVGKFGEVYVMDWGLSRVLGREDRHDIRIKPEVTLSVRSVQTERRDAREDTPDAPIVTMDGDVMGTPAYMPPEQARGEIEKLSPRSDVYGIGAMLYHMLARQAPYIAPGTRVSAHTVLGMVLRAPPVALSTLRKDVPGELLAIVEKAMAREAGDRYADTLSLADDLRAYLEHRVVSAYETGTWAKTKKWVQRNKPLFGASAGLLLVLVLGTGIALQMRVHAARRQLLVSDARAAMDLVANAERLGWSGAQDLGGLRSWLADADALTARHGEHEALLRALETDPSAATQASQMGELIRKTTPAVLALRPGVAAHELFARTIEDRSVHCAEAKRRWEGAIAAIAKNPRYKGLRLTPQVGLLPVGEDTDSHLWEFVHVQTGAPPERGMDGKLISSAEMGLVFVLIPGGTFSMGAERADKRARNYDAQARGDEAPVHEVELSPYFLSKYEMTQGQWERCTGRNPSPATGEQYAKKWNRAGKSWTALHPVEQVSWNQCVEVLARLGLTLPSEAQWENGARAGTGTTWWTGSKLESLAGAANLADAYAHDHDGDSWAGYEKDFDDGNTLHAEVGSYRANAFGLHEVIGNVSEWCLDGYDSTFYAQSPKKDPIVPGSGGSDRVARGGSFHDAALVSRSAARSGDTPDHQYFALGLRPARNLVP